MTFVRTASHLVMCGHPLKIKDEPQLSSRIYKRLEVIVDFSISILTYLIHSTLLALYNLNSNGIHIHIHIIIISHYSFGSKNPFSENFCLDVLNKLSNSTRVCNYVCCHYRIILKHNMKLSICIMLKYRC